MNHRNSVDDRGAIMVIALFFAIFAIAMLYSVVGTAQALLFREKMQDASDAAALSGAVMHARSMNLIVLINIIMAALLAILVTIKLVEALTIVGMVIAGALAWPTFGASLAAIPPLKVIQSNMRAAYEEAKPPIDSALEVLHDTADTVKVVAPAVADAMALGAIEQAKPIPKAGFAVGSRDKLPVEDDGFPTLCGHAGRLPVDLAKSALGKIGVGVVLNPLADGMEAMASEFSEWFCGEGGKSPPSFRQRKDRTYPRMPATLQCEEELLADRSESGSSTESLGPACLERERFEREALPDETTGACQVGHDCTLDSPYEQTVAQARIECDPHGKPRPHTYWYQQRRGRVDYTWNGEGWQRGKPEFERPVRVESKRKAPCGSHDARVAPGYNKTVRRGSTVEEVLPVCSTEEAPRWSGRGIPLKGHVETVAFTEVTQVLACQKTEDIPVMVKDDKSGGDGGSERTSKRVEGTAELGDENFQIRAAVEADLSALDARRGVQLALFERKPPDDPLTPLRAFGGFAVAQAEYFYDDDQGRDEWMWNMKWRARLVRFRLPERDSKPWELLSQACAARLGESCAGILSAITRAGKVISH